jgi:hypothetical protein
MTEVHLCRVPPFGHLRIYASLQLPVAFRRWPRPSSPLGTKASTVRPLYLDLFFFFARELSSSYSSIKALRFSLKSLVNCSYFVILLLCSFQRTGWARRLTIVNPVCTGVSNHIYKTNKRKRSDRPIGIQIYLVRYINSP